MTENQRTHWLGEAKRIGFAAEIKPIEVAANVPFPEIKIVQKDILYVTYTKARRKYHRQFDLSDNGDVQAACNFYAELDRLYTALRKSRATADAYRSVGMTRTPYGWE